MKPVTALLALCIIASLSPGQYVETTVLLPDTSPRLTSVGSLVFHSPTNTVFVGGDERLLVTVNALTNARLGSVPVGTGPHVLCSDPVGNKVYCANDYLTITVIDGATNQSVETISVGGIVTDLCYNRQESKLYCGNTNDGFVRVIDCAGDSVVARVAVSRGPGSLCYNPQLNRIYCAHESSDEVTVIDCAADTVIGSIWVRGVGPHDICYDSASNSVYTANSNSSTVSIIDCAGDSLVRLIAVGRKPVAILTGPPGKVYCANYGDSSVSVISGGGVKTIRTGVNPRTLSFDPVNNKVHCGSDSRALVAVIDAAGDTVLAQLDAGSYPAAQCYNPAGNNTYVACSGDDVASVIGGMSDSVEAVVPFFACAPGPLCYNTTNNRLYCLDDTRGLLFVIDGDSNCVLKTLKVPAAGTGTDTLIWNPVSNKVYVTNYHTNSVSILDCVSDSIVATVATAYSPGALCSSDDGKVYVAHTYYYNGVAVIDGSGDTLVGVVPVRSPTCLCYDRTDNRVYVLSRSYSEWDTVSVIDVSGDSVAAAIPVPISPQAMLCWNQNHDKVYLLGQNNLTVIDCAGDTVLGNISLQSASGPLYTDSVCDKVYCTTSSWMLVFHAATDSLSGSLGLGDVTAIQDNGKEGPANRLYCTDYDFGKVAVVRGYKADSVLIRISVGADPSALAWNPAHSRMYVSNSGSSSISVIRDTFGMGVEESRLQASSCRQRATVVRGMLLLNGLGTRSELPGRNSVMSRAVLLDASGRKVMDLHPGANDVRPLVPGVYFVRFEQSVVSREPSNVTKVVITR
jgi:YVTN family beta-propeller protein